MLPYFAILFYLWMNNGKKKRPRNEAKISDRLIGSNIFVVQPQGGSIIGQLNNDAYNY